MRPMRTRARIAALLTAAALVGCSSYHLGTGTATTRAIEIRPVRNAVPLAGIHAVIHQSLVSALSADPRLRVGNGGETLDTEVTAVERAAATRSTTDALLAGQFRVTLTVRCTLRSADGRQVRFSDRPFSASALLSATGDLSAEERAAMPRLAAEIATQVRDAAAGAW